MRTPRYSTLVSLVVGSILLFGAPTSTLIGYAAQKDKKDKEAEKVERNFAKLKQRCDDMYNKDESFKQEVDEAYQQLQRKHSQEAFKINTFDVYSEQSPWTGDLENMPPLIYDNPLVQDYVNRLGQSLVPPGSPFVYGFKVILNPIPEARTLSTGTVYISTGLLAFVDNEAQLAYALSHEIAHIEKEHWKQDVLIYEGQEQINENQQKKQERIGLLGRLAAPFIPGVNSGFAAGFAVISTFPTVLKLLIPTSTVAWDKFQEDDADKLAMEYMIRRNYDPREVPKFFARLKRGTQNDRRSKLGFLANVARLAERSAQIDQFIGSSSLLNSSLVAGTITLSQVANKPTPTYNSVKGLSPERNAGGREAAANERLSGALSAELKTKLENGELIGSGPEFIAVMAELKRDNGYRALQFDMFQVARDSLRESLEIRSNDPLTHYYYGLVLKQIGRTESEKLAALQEFNTAVDLDQRQVLPEARLQRALARMATQNEANSQEIVADLKTYVDLYQRDNAGRLPKNMDIIYGYLQEVGELSWSSPPVGNISTKNIEPITAVQPAPPPATYATRPVEPAPEPTGRRGTKRKTP